MCDDKIKYMQYIDYLWYEYKKYKETAKQHMFVHLIMYDSKLIPAYNDLQENYNKEHAEIFIKIMHKVLKFLGVKFTSLDEYNHYEGES